MKKLLALVLVFGLLWTLLPLQASAAEQQAQNLTPLLRAENESGFSDYRKLLDGNTRTSGHFPNGSRLRLEYSGGIGSVYLIFQESYGTYSIINNDTGKTAAVGQYGFLHDYVDLVALFGSAPASITLSFDNGSVRIREISAYSPGQPPEDVQIWQPPAEGNADLLLFSAHGDDEQLFFAGILPYYAGERNYKVQVVYLTDHHNSDKNRVHEMLDGLYAVGVTHYPVFGTFNDQRAGSGEIAYQLFSFLGISREDVIGFMVEQLRRFKPLVAVTHDINGEYGHGQHELCADMMMQASAISMDAAQYPETAQRYGTWDVPKTYLHLYWENPIWLDFDQPLARFNGMTAYEVTRDLGFPCHKTQYNDFKWYFAGSDKAADIPLYSPCEYGLYRSTVGPDVQKNDFFENLRSYDQQAADALRRQVIEEAVRKIQSIKITLP